MNKLIVCLALLAGLLLAAPAGAEDDVTPPQTGIFNGPNMSLTAHPEFAWESYDWSGVASFDVRVSRTPFTAARRARWTYPAELQGISRTTITPYVAAGDTICIQVRGRDTLGNLEPWHQEWPYTCQSRALDDSKLHRSGPMRVVENKHFWHGHARVLYPGGHLWLNGLRKGAHAGVLMTVLPDETRGGSWSIPGWPSMAPIGRPAKPAYSQAIDYVNTAKWKGRLLISWDGRVTQPFEGAAIYPRWMQLHG
jgi:hypothetical protein